MSPMDYDPAMDRRDWLRMAGSAALSGFAGLTGCAAPGVAGSPLHVTAEATRRLRSGGAAGHAIWQGGRQIAGENTNARIGSLSLTKALASLAVVRAIGEGWLSPDGPLTDVIPEWKGDPSRSRVTVRMLVNQSAGFPPSPGPLYHGTIRDKGKVAVSLHAADPPGAVFRYGPASWEILAELLHRKLAARGSSLEAFVARTFRRIGMSSPDWRKDGSGRWYLSTGAAFSVRDLGRLGRTIGSLARGADASGLGASVFRDLSSPRSANPMFGAGIWWNRNARRAGAYAVEPERVLDGVRGPDFWRLACLSPAIDPDWLALVGSGGKRVYVLPEKDLVIARLGRAYGWDDGAFLRSVTA